MLAGKLEGTYLPDGIIPFKITKEEATEKFVEWIQKKKFVPTGFSSKRHIEKMSGVYFPYWLYGCATDSYMNGTARDIRIWRVGDIEYTETKTFQIHRAGKVSFRHLPKTGLEKAQNALLKGIFPYEFGALEKFHMGYLSGFQAEKRDIDKENYIEEIKKRSLYDTGVDVNPTDKLLTLSTCCKDFDDARLVVVARLVRPGESADVDVSRATVNSNPRYPQAWYNKKGKTNPYKNAFQWEVS